MFIFRIIIISVILFSFGMYGKTQYSYREPLLRPLSEPIDISTISEYEFAFTSQRSINYEIELTTERLLEFEEQQARLGLPSFDSTQFKEVLQINWEVLHNDDIIAKGASNESQSGFYGVDMGKNLGEFETINGQSYTIKVSVKQVDPILNSTNPKVNVSIDKRFLKNAFISRGIDSLMAYLVFAVGVFLGAIYLIITYIQKRKK